MTFDGPFQTKLFYDSICFLACGLFSQTDESQQDLTKYSRDAVQRISHMLHWASPAIHSLRTSKTAKTPGSCQRGENLSTCARQTLSAAASSASSYDHRDVP